MKLENIQKDFFNARNVYKTQSIDLLMAKMNQICSKLEKGQYIDFQAHLGLASLIMPKIVCCRIEWEGRKFVLSRYKLQQKKEISKKVYDEIKVIENEVVTFIRAQQKNDVDSELMRTFLNVIHGVWGHDGRVDKETAKKLFIKSKIKNSV